MALLMVMMPIASAGTSQWSGPSTVGSSVPGEGIIQSMEGWNWASNQSVEGATLLLNPLYQAAENNGTHWSVSSGEIFDNGTFQSVQSHSIAHALALENSNPNVQFTNFTNASDAFIEFTSGGNDSDLWNPVNLSAIVDENFPPQQRQVILLQEQSDPWVMKMVHIPIFKHLSGTFLLLLKVSRWNSIHG